jgi:LacI family transcriptional regulator
MTIYDIAKLAGVSASTVSRAMNGKAGVSEAKRAQINEILRQNNYAPDENARNLVTQNTRTIGILTDDLGSKHQNEGKATIEREIMSHGYYCFGNYVGTGPTAIEDGLAELARRRVAGALLLGVSFLNHTALRSAIQMYLPDVPVVLVHQTERIDLDNVYSVGANEQKGFLRCVSRMAERGRRNLVLLIDQKRVSAQLIRESFELGLRGYPGVKGWVYADIEPTVDGGMNTARRILREHPEADGLICAQDSIAIGAMYGMQDSGRRVPDDISVIGEDNSELCEVCRPRLTSLDTMLGVTTVMSARIMLDLLKGREQAHCIQLEMELAERGTL